MLQPQEESECCPECQESEDFCTCHVNDTCGVCGECIDDCECSEAERDGALITT